MPDDDGLDVWERLWERADANPLSDEEAMELALEAQAAVRREMREGRPTD